MILFRIKYPSEKIAVALSNCAYLSTLYLDLEDPIWFKSLVRELNLPALSRLHMPMVPDRPEDFIATNLTFVCMTEFLKRHEKTLQQYQFFDAARYQRCFSDITRTLVDWRTEEIRYDSHSMDPDIVTEGVEFLRVAQYLGIIGDDSWTGGLRRARLDRFNLTNVHKAFDEAFKHRGSWKNIKVLVLNPNLGLHVGLFPEPGGHKSLQRQELELTNILRSIDAPREDEQEMAERIIQKMDSDNIRVISIGLQRFWIDHESGPRRRRKVWSLRAALQDDAQRRQITEHLNQKDWEFLSERSTDMTRRSANTATFTKISELDSRSRVPARYILDDVSLAEFSRFPESQRRETLKKLLVACKPIVISESGAQKDFKGSIEEYDLHLLSPEWTNDKSISVEAASIYYGENDFRLQLPSLWAFLYEAWRFLKKMTVTVPIVSRDQSYRPENLLDLLRCEQLQDITLQISGYQNEINALVNDDDIIKPLKEKFGSLIKIYEMPSE